MAECSYESRSRLINITPSLVLELAPTLRSRFDSVEGKGTEYASRSVVRNGEKGLGDVSSVLCVCTSRPCVYPILACVELTQRPSGASFLSGVSIECLEPGFRLSRYSSVRFLCYGDFLRGEGNAECGKVR